MKQAWHTEGYDKLSRVFWYLTTEAATGRSPYEVNSAVEVITKAGREIKAQVRRNANRRAKHAALTSLGLKRVKGALGGTYYE